MSRVPESDRKTSSTTARPRPGEGSGRFIQRLWITTEMSPEEILAAVHVGYEGKTTRVRDVYYNYKKLVESGTDIRPWPGRRNVKSSSTGVDREASPRVSDHTPQPTRRKTLPGHVDPDRRFDTTSLRRGGSQERTVHRDYAAHFFRWGFAGRFINGRTDVLDVGCGPDVPLVGILNHPRSNVPRSYVGVDMNKQPKFVPSRQWGQFLWEFDITTRYQELGQFDVVVCFEVIEHMRVSDGKRLLSAVRECMREDATFLLSTPVYDGRAAAANHVHEWTIPELRSAIEWAGLEVRRRHGTFASHNDIRRVATPDEVRVMRSLSEYYSGEVVACFLAPLHPDASRNNVWVIKRELTT